MPKMHASFHKFYPMHNQTFFPTQEEVYSNYYPPYYNPMYFPTVPPQQISYPYPYYPPPIYQTISSPRQFEKFDSQYIFSTQFVKKEVNVEEEVKRKTQRGRPKNKVNQQKKGKSTRPKKNVQSNISNQVFSFIISQKKSGQSTRKIIKNDQKKVSAFYNYVNCLAKYKRKYLNRKYLGDLCILAPQSTQYNDIIQKYPKQVYLSMDDFRSVLSMLIFHFLRDRCSLTILTSSKMSSQLRIQHMERRRQILTYMEQYVKPDIRFH